MGIQEGRKETREAFFKAGSKGEADYIKFAKRRAGGEEAYRTQLAAEKKAEEGDQEIPDLAKQK